MPPFNEAYLTERIGRRLGGSGVNVELSPADYEDAIQDALWEFGRWVPKRRLGNITMVAGQQAYSLTPDQVGLGILRVEWPPEYDYDPEDVFDAGVVPELFSGQTSLGEYVEKVMYIKQAQRVFDEDPNWEWRPEEGILYISPAPSANYNGMDLSYEYAEFPALSDIPIRHWKWILDYATACAKEVLGRIRGKFPSNPGDQTDETSDGDTLLNEAREEKERLMEALRSRSPAPPPMWG